MSARRVLCLLLNHRWRPAEGAHDAAQCWRCARCGKVITGSPHGPTLHDKTAAQGPLHSPLP